MKIKCFSCFPKSGRKNHYELAEATEVYRTAQTSPKMTVHFQNGTEDDGEIAPVVVLREAIENRDGQEPFSSEKEPCLPKIQGDLPPLIDILPEGSSTPILLPSAMMIQHILDILPACAQSYPWREIYSTEKHGFSLKTLYRHMEERAEAMAPILLIVRTLLGQVFGAIVTSPLKVSPHYYGTGNSCLLFRFEGAFPNYGDFHCYRPTNLNNFFIHGTHDSISFGASDGHFGLWIDADLNHGLTQTCETYNNEPLVDGTTENFGIQALETYSFSFGFD